MRAQPILASMLFLGACDIPELSEAWTIDRTRVLAVKAEPAEPAPGETVLLSSLTVDPDQEPMVLWVGCEPSFADDFGCDFEQAEYIGLDPIDPPGFLVPADLLEGLDEAQQTEGVNYTVMLSALAEDTDLAALAEQLEQGADQVLDGDTLLELAYKRVPVSLGGDPNRNPSVDKVVVQGQELVAGSTLVVNPGQTYDFDAVLSEDSIQTYEYINSSGESEERIEEPYYTWFASAGQFLSYPVALHPTTVVSWTAPVEAEQSGATLWLVVRDRRGGMDWLEVNVVVADP